MNKMYANLFSNLLMEKPSLNKGLDILTPLGMIEFSLFISDESIVSYKCDSFESKEEMHISTWKSESFVIEALTIPFIFESVEFPTDGNFAQVFRIYAKKKILKTNIKISLVNNNIYCESSSAPGQDIEALKFISPKGSLSIGTDDIDMLNARARQGDWMPKRWKGVFDYALEKFPFKFTENSIATTFPELYEGEKLQVSYIVSWVNPLYDSFNPRIAVDMPVKTLFEIKGLEYW